MSIKNYLNSQQNQHLNELIPFLKIPSVSADSSYKQQVLDCAHYLKEFCISAGFDTVELLESNGFPAIFAQIGVDPSKKTVLFYGHYDVQPADPLHLWDSPAFEPSVRNGYIYARGVADDKGQVYCHLLAIKALIDQQMELPVNIKILIEGEEEIGSPHLSELLVENKQRLSADYIVISDTPMFSKKQPSLCTSIRGLVHSEVTLKSISHDLHSGQHGGSLHNPIQRLSEMLSRLIDSKGKITIPHFYDDVSEVSSLQKQHLNELDFSENAYYQSVGTKKGFGEHGYTCLERRWYRPCLDCNGIYGGYTGEGSKTVLPASATMKLSIRLVANQDPKKIAAQLDKYLYELCPSELQMEVSTHAAGPAYSCNLKSPAIIAAKNAIYDAFNKKPLFTAEGGSIPIVSLMASILNAEVVLMGFNLPDDAIHAPNERFLIEHFHKGIQAAAYFYQNL